jgi:signal transduction histidine kinase
VADVTAPRLGSVRVRTTAAVTLLVAVGLGLAAWLLLVQLDRSLTTSQDDSSRGRARDLAVLVRADRLPATVAALGDDTFAQVVDGTGRVLAATPGVRGRPALATFPVQPSGIRVGTVGVRDGPEHEVYRVWGLRTRGPAGPTIVYVGASLELVSEATATLRDLLLVGVPVVSALLGLLTWVALGRMLAPVESITRQVAGIGDAELDRRVPVPRTGDEIAELAGTMNAMLQRLEEARERQQTFVADASHELQSPLTRLRTQLEVARLTPAPDWDEVTTDLLADCGEMEALVRDLLFLARDGSSRSVIADRVELVDLDDVVLEEAARVRSGARVEVSTTAVSAAPVRGSREQLRRLSRNLLENAVAAATSRVDVSLQADWAGAVLVVEDDGPGIPADQRDRVFERFVRLDGARDRTTGGSGLGLAIVSSIARQHGGSAAVEESPAGARLVVRLPGWAGAAGDGPGP